MFSTDVGLVIVMNILKYFTRSTYNNDCNLTQDQIHEILSASRRRIAIQIISDVGKTTIGDLADEISDVENSGRQTVYVGLYQNHLSVLEKYEVIEYDSDRGTINSGKNIAVLVDIIRDVHNRLE